MQMDSVLSGHIVLVARVREVVHLYVVLHALAYETEAMLPKDHGIDGSLADEQFALKILCLVDQACLFISLRVSITGPPATATLNTSG